jgi:hypothetical protein
LVGDLDGLGELAGLDVAVERREEVLHGDWLRGSGRRGLRFGRHDVLRSGSLASRDPPARRRRAASLAWTGEGRRDLLWRLAPAEQQQREEIGRGWIRREGVADGQGLELWPEIVEESAGGDGGVSMAWRREVRDMQRLGDAMRDFFFFDLRERHPGRKRLPVPPFR